MTVLHVAGQNGDKELATFLFENGELKIMAAAVLGFLLTWMYGAALSYWIYVANCWRIIVCCWRYCIIADQHHHHCCVCHMY